MQDGTAVGILLDINWTLTTILVAKVLDEEETNLFFNICRERLLEQNFLSSDIDEIINTLKESINKIRRGYEKMGK
jgi:hypothetical protein